MKATTLLEALLAEPDLPHDEIQKVFDQLPEGTSLTVFRSALIDQKVLSYSQAMNIFITKTLLPKSQNLLSTLEQKRQQQAHFKPVEHQQKYHIDDDDKMRNSVPLFSGEVEIDIPMPDIKKLHFVQSDEKQAVTLALELINMGELKEVELILLETLESFENSQAAAEVLAWVYLCTGHFSDSENCAKSAIDAGLNNQEILELLALAEQLQNKHMLATAQYQKLLQLERVKSLWYLLIAYSQERSNCQREAAENYQIYAAIGNNPDLKEVAVQHLRVIKG